MEIRRYDIVQADLSGTVGSEQGGVRPVLIIQNDIGNTYSPTTIVMPFSTKTFKNPNQPTHTLIRSCAGTGLKEDSVLLGEQMRVISNQRIKKKIGRITDESKNCFSCFNLIKVLRQCTDVYKRRHKAPWSSG